MPPEKRSVLFAMLLVWSVTVDGAEGASVAADLTKPVTLRLASANDDTVRQSLEQVNRAGSLILDIDARRAQLGHATWSLLFHASHRLHHVELGDSNIADEDLAALADQPELQGLDLTATSVTGSGLDRPWPATLSVLNCSKVKLTAGLPWQRLVGAKRVVLSQADLGSAPVDGLAALQQLEELDVDDARVNVEAVLTLAASFPKLRMLRLDGTIQNAALLQRLAGHAPIEDLRLERCHVSGGLAVLGGLPKLVTLSLRESDVSDADLEALAGCSSLKNLFLDDTAITDACAKTIHAMPALSMVTLSGTALRTGLAEIVAAGKVTGLAMDRMQLSDADLAVVFAHGSGAIKQLNLSRNLLTDAAVTTLSSLTVEKLNLIGNQLSQQAVRRLQKALPQTAILAP